MFGAGSEASSSEIRITPVGISQIAQKPQNRANRCIAGIGAMAMRKMPTISVKMPRTDGAIITPMVISAAFTRSFTWE